MINTKVKSASIEQEFNNLFTSYSKTLCDKLYYKFGDYEKAKDITQESFIKLWSNQDKINDNNIKGYLYTISINAFLNDIKHQKIVKNYEKGEVSNSGLNRESPDYILEEKEFQTRLDLCILNLPVKQRTVFLMNRIDRKTQQEIATELNLSKKAIEKRVKLAKESLAKSVGIVF